MGLVAAAVAVAAAAAGEKGCLWRQVLISNQMPVMRSLFPHIQIDVM